VPFTSKSNGENGIEIRWFLTKLQIKISWLLFMAHDGQWHRLSTTSEVTAGASSKRKSNVDELRFSIAVGSDVHVHWTQSWVFLCLPGSRYISDCASVRGCSVDVGSTSQTSECPPCHGIKDHPSERFPSCRSSSESSLTAGIPAAPKARQMMSLVPCNFMCLPAYHGVKTLGIS